MDSYRKSKKQSLGVFIAVAVSLAMVFFSLTPQDSMAKEKEIITKTIKIEGTIERPKIIFIVPRAVLWDSTILDKDFTKEILKINHPLMWQNYDYKKNK